MTPTVNRIKAIAVPAVEDRAGAYRLADAAVRRWLADAFALLAEHQPSYEEISPALTAMEDIIDTSSLDAAAAVVDEARATVAPDPDHQVTAGMALSAERLLAALAAEQWNIIGRNAAFILYERIAAKTGGPDYVVAEAQAVLH